METRDYRRRRRRCEGAADARAAFFVLDGVVVVVVLTRGATGTCPMMARMIWLLLLFMLVTLR